MYGVKNKVKIISLVSLVVLLSLSLYGKQIIKEVTLAAGEEKIIKVPKLKGISNAGNIIKDIPLHDGESIIFRAVSWGDTQVMTWDTEGNQTLFKVHVNVPKYVKELESYLQGIEGVNVGFLGKNIIVEGQILREGDPEKLMGILKTYSSSVQNMAKMDILPINKSLLEAAKAETNNSSLSSSSLGGGDQGLIIEGKTFRADKQKEIESVLSFYFDSVYPTIQVLKPKIQLNLSFLEVSGKNKNQSNYSEFHGFYQAFKINKSKDIFPFQFFESITQDEARETIEGSSKVQLIKKLSEDIEDFNYTFKDEGGDGKFFQIYMTLIPSDTTWMTCKYKIQLGGKKDFNFEKKGQVILKQGKTVALIGLADLLKESFGEEVIAQELKDFPLLNGFSDPALGKNLVMLLTPSWTLE